MHGRPRPENRGRPPWPALAMLVAVALALHAALLVTVAADRAEPRPAPPAAALQVRTLPAPLPVAEEPTAPVADTAQATTPAPTIAPAVKRAAAPARPAAPAPQPAPAVEPPPVMVAEAASSAAAEPAPPLAPPPLVAADSAPPGAAGDDEIPVYKTLIPPPVTLSYELHRGLLGGTGTLFWRPAGDRYEARLEARVAGLAVLTQVSEGGFDDAGLAPNRFTDQRMGREVRAANFQREHGKITFSGPSNEFTLLIGAQDRLSWMVQLAAVVAAEPRRVAPGGKVALYVVGARADASMWVFRSAGEETVDTPGGPVRAVKFSRDARGPYDTQADAWLDPARHYLPVRARLGSGGDGDALDLVLRDMKPQ